jgi:hypothetical protein
MKTEKLNQVHLIKLTEKNGCTQHYSNQEDVLSNLENWIAANNSNVLLTEYPFKIVLDGKKYFMIADENGMSNNNKASSFNFNDWGMKAKFLYKHNDQPVHKEDLEFNGIYGYGEFANMMHFWGKIVLVEESCQYLY